MQYRFQGDVLQLIRYRIGWTGTRNVKCRKRRTSFGSLLLRRKRI